MVFHVCESCSGFDIGSNKFPKTSSGDVNLTFKNGNKWVMPDMILHYVADHNWGPPQIFVDDVMNGELLRGNRVQTRGHDRVYEGSRVGYLVGDILPGAVPDGFVERLEALMVRAAGMGMRAQTKGTIQRGL